jgi:hypothetical protein
MTVRYKISDGHQLVGIISENYDRANIRFYSTAYLVFV